MHGSRLYSLPADFLPLLFARCGFEATACEPCYDDGQYLRLEARLGSAEAAPVVSDETMTDALHDTVTSYSLRHDEAVEDWRTRLAALGKLGKRVAVWGAGGRGTTFLNTVCLDPAESLDRIQFAVDVNPERQGKFVPRTGHAIVAPEQLRARPVDVVIITNETYESEIRAEAHRLGLAREFVVA